MLKRILFIVSILITASACNEFLDKGPLGVASQDVFYNDPANAIQGINAVYAATILDEHGIGQGGGHTYDFMYGDILSDDAYSGSQSSDGLAVTLTQMKEWKTTASVPQPIAMWNNMYIGITRANQVISLIENATIEEGLKNRIKGEAHFLRAYFYATLVKNFGGVILLTDLPTGEQTSFTRASISETYQLIEQDLNKAIELLPEKSGYAAEDLGRATKGAARGFLARAIMYQIGTDNTNGHTWQEVYDLTHAVVASGEYALMPNYAQIFEKEGENGVESIFEIQATDGAINFTGSAAPFKTGTTNTIIQGVREGNWWGWGFNSPSHSLLSAYENDTDPRKAATCYLNDGGVMFGIAVKSDKPTEVPHSSGYFSRKAQALNTSIDNKDNGKNIRKMRYADILLMKAEAAFNTGKEGEARDILNQIRSRARNSTLPKGTVVGNANAYPAAGAVTLPDIGAGVTGVALQEAIWKERRVELGMETLRFMDLVRTGKYMPYLESIQGTMGFSADMKANCESHSIPVGGTVVNPIPLLPIPLTEVQTWGLTQNPNY
jgi:starch-binding outer membrane protein, SusD/RagB family